MSFDNDKHYWDHVSSITKYCTYTFQNTIRYDYCFWKKATVFRVSVETDSETEVNRKKKRTVVVLVVICVSNLHEAKKRRRNKKTIDCQATKIKHFRFVSLFLFYFLFEEFRNCELKTSK